MFKVKNMSFKIKTILGVALIEAILLAIIYFTSINSLNETNENQIKTRALETSTLISLWVRNGLLTYDVGNTEHFTNSLVAGERLVYVHIKNEEGNTFAFSGDESYRNIKISPDISLETAQLDGVYDSVVPVTIDDMVIGSVEIGLPIAALSVFINDVADKLKLIAVLEIILSGLFSFGLGWFLTRRLEMLKRVALKIKNTGELVLTGDTANDEIGTVSQAMDQMVQTLIKSQLDLKSKSMRLEKIFNSSQDGMIVFDTKGSLVTINPAMKKIMNCTANFNGCTYSDFIKVVQKQLDSDFNSVKWLNEHATFDMIKEEFNETIRFIKPNPRLLSIKSHLINDASLGIHSIFYFTDLTKTEEVERLKSEFLAHAAHELRTPLTSVQGFSELLTLEGISEQDRVEYAQIINTQSKRVVDMVGELLDISLIEAEGVKSLTLELTDIRQVIDRVLKDYRVDISRAPVQITYPDKGIPNIHIDVERVYQIILNLISNAYKYSSGSQKVTVSVNSFDIGNSEADGQGVIIKIIDEGQGMSKEELSHLFTRFWRADKSGSVPGTGLGMSIVKELMTLHSANIEVVSESGKGTEVRLKFYR